MEVRIQLIEPVPSGRSFGSNLKARRPGQLLARIPGFFNAASAAPGCSANRVDGDPPVAIDLIHSAWCVSVWRCLIRVPLAASGNTPAVPAATLQSPLTQGTLHDALSWFLFNRTGPNPAVSAQPFKQTLNPKP